MGVRRPRTTGHRVFLHVCAAVVVPGCLVLAWWQASRALSGNTLSWAYTFEWPVFAGYAVFMWWRLLHEPSARPEAHLGTASALLDGGQPGRGGPVEDPAPDRPQPAADGDREEDPALAEYNDYLAALSASGRRKRW